MIVYILIFYIDLVMWSTKHIPPHTHTHTNTKHKHKHTHNFVGSSVLAHSLTSLTIGISTYSHIILHFHQFSNTVKDNKSIIMMDTKLTEYDVLAYQAFRDTGLKADVYSRFMYARPNRRIGIGGIRGYLQANFTINAVH